MVTIVFDQPGDFEACAAAEKWCGERGISVGEMQGPAPRGLLLGDYCIAKWRNLTNAEKRELNGRMTGAMRNGPVTITLDGDADAYPNLAEQKWKESRDTIGNRAPIDGNLSAIARAAKSAASLLASGDEP